MSASPLYSPHFSVWVAFEGRRVVLGLRGRIDRPAARELDALAETLLDRGYGSLVMDLAGVPSIDAAGIDVISRTAARVKAAGGEPVMIHEPSDKVRRALVIAGLTELVRAERPMAAEEPLGREEARETPAAAGSARRPAAQPRKLLAIPAAEDVIDAALQLVVALATATVGGAQGASVTLLRRDRLSTVAASDQTIMEMDQLQYETQQGPCVSATAEGRWFHVQSLTHEDRWPEFTPLARELGVNAILSSPLLLASDQPVGALNIYSRAAAAFAPHDQEIAEVLATQASSILFEAGADGTQPELSRRLAEALRSREVIAQAQGVLMARDGIGEHAAYAALRRSSAQSSAPLREQAAAVVASTQPHSSDSTVGVTDGR